MPDPNPCPLQHTLDLYHSAIADELKRVSAAIIAVDTKVDAISGTHIPNLRVELQALKTQATVWGTIAGTFGAALITFLFKFLSP